MCARWNAPGREKSARTFTNPYQGVPLDAAPLLQQGQYMVAVRPSDWMPDPLTRMAAEVATTVAAAMAAEVAVTVAEAAAASVLGWAAAVAEAAVATIEAATGVGSTECGPGAVTPTATSRRWS